MSAEYKTFTYNPNFFRPISLDDAKRIVLGYGITESPHRWIIETAWIEQLFVDKNFLNENSVVLDWGCGIGRLSKMVIEKFNCRVVGVDISEDMLRYAKDYVNSKKFTATLVKDFNKNKTLKFSNVIAVWALQHTPFIDADLSIINDSLNDNGKLFVFEEITPAIPVVDDGQGKWGLLNDYHHQTKILEKFNLIEQGSFPKILNVPENDNAWWGFLKKK